MRNVVKSAGRALEILELFQRHQRPLNATEICAELGYPNSSSNVLLRSLVQLSYLTLDTNSMRYFPSMKLAQLGEWVPPHLVPKWALQAMDEVWAETEETVCLSMQSDLQMQFVRALRGKHSISLMAKTGYRFPVIGTVVGVALLSTQEPQRVESLFSRVNRDDIHRPDRGAIARTRELLNVVRTSGVAVAYDWYIPDAGTIAVPIRLASDERVAVISVAGLASRVRRREKKIIQTIDKSIRRTKKSNY